MFIRQDLDILASLQTTSGQSYRNPAERVMSLLNLLCSNLTMERVELEDPLMEKMYSRCGSMKSARELTKKYPILEEMVLKAVDPVIKRTKSHIQAGVWTGSQIIVKEAARREDKDDQLNWLTLIDRDFDISKSNNSVQIQKWFDDHYSQTYYGACLHKCDNIEECATCLPLRLPSKVFDVMKLWVPCPKPDPENTGHYLPFHRTFGSTEADFKDSYRPGRHKKQDRKILGIPFKNPTKAQYAQNSGIVMKCPWCLKPRALYTQRKLSVLQADFLTHYSDEFLQGWSCGAPFQTDASTDDVISIVFSNQALTCDSEVEAALFKIDGHANTCKYCGQEESDVEKGFFPLCQDCKKLGKAPRKTRSRIIIPRKRNVVKSKSKEAPRGEVTLTSSEDEPEDRKEESDESASEDYEEESSDEGDSDSSSKGEESDHPYSDKQNVRTKGSASTTAVGTAGCSEAAQEAFSSSTRRAAAEPRLLHLRQASAKPSRQLHLGRAAGEQHPRLGDHQSSLGPRRNKVIPGHSGGHQKRPVPEHGDRCQDLQRKVPVLVPQQSGVGWQSDQSFHMESDTDIVTNEHSAEDSEMKRKSTVTAQGSKNKQRKIFEIFSRE